MLRKLLPLFVIFLARAEQPLSLQDAVRTALAKHPAAEASAAMLEAAGARVRQARSGYLPKVSYQEAWQRSNNPVFVFSSLLTQHQFREENFAVGQLNRPESINNFQSQLVLDQRIWDGGRRRSEVRSAELGREISAEDDRRTRMNLVAGVVRSYHGTALARESLEVARQAVRSAEADLTRADAVRAAGMSTDADVLSIRVHLGAMREQEIRRVYELDVAWAALNDALGLPLDTRHALVTPLAMIATTDLDVTVLEKRALEERPEMRQSRDAARLAEWQRTGARAALLPQLSLRAVFEADRQTFATRGGANWFAGATLHWSFFNGFADRARIEEAAHTLRAAEARGARTSSGVRLEVRRAWADLQASGERVAVASSVVAMAEESARITKNRYEAGLSTVTELLRSETALLEARTRRLAAAYDQRVAAANLELATGALSGDSDVLK